MKRCVLYTVLLHLAALLVMSAPLAFLAGFDCEHLRFGFSPFEVLQLYTQPWFWIVFAAVGVFVALLLLLPLDFAQNRPPPPWKRVLAKAGTSLLVGLVFLSAFFFAVVAFSKDNGKPAWVEKISSTLATYPAICSVFWLVSGIAFFKAARNDGAEAIVERTSRWLTRGGLVLCFVTASCYVSTSISRVCCAPQITFIAGIVPAMIILLLARTPRAVFDWVRQKGADRN